MTTHLREHKTVTARMDTPMNSPSDNLSKFRAAYLDYIEGDRHEPPPQDCLNEKQRRIADAFIESTAVAKGIDPYASRPSTERLLAGIRAAGGIEGTREGLTPAARWTLLRKTVPLAKIRSRGWIPVTSSLEATEAAVCELLQITSLEERPDFAAAARRSNSQEHVTPSQIAWLGRVRRLAEGQEAESFDVAALRGVAGRLPREVQDGPKSLAKLPGILAGYGVRLVFLEGLPGGKIDGAVSFIEGGRGPVIGLTARWDRFDSLLYTLLHECAHLTLGHIEEGSAAILDENLAQEHTDTHETQANEQASDWLFPDGFRIEPFGPSRIEETAKQYSVHPSCVIGRIQHDQNAWTLLRNSIPKVRDELRAVGLIS